ncbi:hypothetical protein PAPYR_12622 [Paratrimastix pyriformis]|uniref:Uncharacterized protein n=1 Tax=Paratrimastix pyriformis TaxID=342808 RepID=A0ABQ8U1K5_9EUKA|nr:hypothetical protein PAPYR_12622 [Paratrimastix pyriformis]
MDFSTNKHLMRRRYPTPRHSRDDSSEEEPRGHSRKRARAEPKSSAADAAPASPLRLDTVTEDEAEQRRPNAPARNTRRPNRNKEIQHASQDADQHHPVVFIPSAEHSSSSEHARASVLPEPPTAEPEETPEPEQTTVPEQTTEPVPEQTNHRTLETTTTEPEVTTSDPVQATTTEPAEPSEPEPAQSELQQTGTEPEAAEQSVPGEPEQLAEAEQPAEPELTPNPSRPQPLLRRPQSSPNAGPPLRRRRLPLLRNRGRVRLPRNCPTPSRPRRQHRPPAIKRSAPVPRHRSWQPNVHRRRRLLVQSLLSRRLRLRHPCLPEPTCSPCRVLRLTCSPGHRHEHYCHASSSGSGSGFRASQNPTCSPVTATSTTATPPAVAPGRASVPPRTHVQPGHRHEHDCKASSSGSGSSFRASQNARTATSSTSSVPPTTSSPHQPLSSSNTAPAPQSDLPRLAIGDKGSVETHSTGILRTDLSQAAGKLVPEHKPSESRSHRPCSFFETMAEYRLSGAICVELHKVLNRLGLTFGKILFSMTCGQSADIDKTYQFLTSRALMILVCLDSEAAFGVDRAVDGHMRLDELAL